VNTELNFDGVTSVNWNNLQGKEVARGIFEHRIWEGEKGKRAIILKFEANSKYPGVDVHQPGPEQIYVISGVFNDGKEDHSEGSFINHPIGTAHIPQSKTGCIVLVLFPEG